MLTGFNHCTISLGAIYLVIMNLPRKERYVQEGKAGLLPPLESEPNSLNTFLTPLVNELKDLWTGVHFYTSESPRYKVLVKGALICAACNVPAAHKLCGFKGHNANRGCSTCFEFFPGPVTKTIQDLIIKIGHREISLHTMKFQGSQYSRIWKWTFSEPRNIIHNSFWIRVL